MLSTEKRNSKSMNIDKMSSSEMVRLMQEEYLVAAMAVEAELERISLAVDEIADRMKRGGRLFYIGAGTSGRLGVLDASECPPTFGVHQGLVVGIIAGGDGALRNAVEGAEDNALMGEADLLKHGICELDSVIGISVAGGARYVLGAVRAAKTKGAFTVGLTCNEDSELDVIADVGIHPKTGAEVISGSTRMKAGSAHKMILNMISTSVMVKLGYVYENLMINLRPSNEKLKKRMIGIVGDICKLDPTSAEKLLSENGFVIRDAIKAYNEGAKL